MEYGIEQFGLTDQERLEVEASELFDGAADRGVYIAIAHYLLGKALRIHLGIYGDDLDDMEDNEGWVNDLISAANKILKAFKQEEVKKFRELVHQGL